MSTDPETVLHPVLHPGRRAVDPDDDRPAVGSWWWVTARSERSDEGRYDRPGRQWLACVVELGSNYAKLEGVRLRQRVGLDDFHSLCAPEPAPRAFIDAQIDKHRGAVRRLMSKIADLCHRLGVPMRQALAAQESASTALSVAHAVDDVKRYKNALVKAKEKTLPELFRQVKEQHTKMAVWMKAELIPAQAELSAAEEVTEVIEGKIHTVELYAGLQEELVCVREGEPAALDAKVHLMQRMHFMDEEYLARYEAGGMNFKDVGAFDAWLARDGNFGRILPHERSVVAFRVRRNRKDYGDLHPFISLEFHQRDRQTFLYLRNGRQLWRMHTSLEFSEGLFPRREDEDLLGDQELWVKAGDYDLDRHDGVRTRRQRDHMIDHHRAKRAYLAQKLWQWHRAGKPEGHGSAIDPADPAGTPYGAPARVRADTPGSCPQTSPAVETRGDLRTCDLAYDRQQVRSMRVNAHVIRRTPTSESAPIAHASLASGSGPTPHRAPPIGRGTVTLRDGFRVHFDEFAGEIG